MEQFCNYITNIRENSKTLDPSRDTALKTFSHCTWKEWRFMRRSRDEPIYEQKIRACQQDLIKYYSSHCLHTCRGAYFPLQSFFLRILDWKLSRHQLDLTQDSDDDITIKISWDGYSHFHQKLESWYLVFYNVVHMQSSLHAHCFAIARMSESAENFQTVCTEIDLDGFVSWLLSFNILIDAKLYHVDLTTSCDWIGLVVELGAPRPGTRSLTDVVCPSCGCDKNYLRHLWFKAPWQVKRPLLDISHFPKAAIPSLSLSKRRYDWMHGCTLLLHHCLMNIYLDIPPRSTQKTQFFTLVAKVRKNWSTKNLIEPIGMKKWWSSDWKQHFKGLFNSSSDTLFVPWNEEDTWICSELKLWTLLIDSCRVYFDFAYKRYPLQEDYLPLYYARHSICSIFAFKRWRLDPTTHFMLNEAIVYALQDGGAFKTLQEGVEHANHDVKADCRCTSARDLTEALDHQEVERRLIELNYHSATTDEDEDVVMNKPSLVSFAMYTPLMYSVVNFSE